MSDTQAQIAELLHEAGETHHQVYRITDGVDADWASWYADWLIHLSELPKVLGTAPVRSELVYILVKLDKDFTRNAPGGAVGGLLRGRTDRSFQGRIALRVGRGTLADELRALLRERIRAALPIEPGVLSG